MHIDTLLERNREFVRRRTARPFPNVEPIELAVIACYDPRLDDLLLPALGLEAGDAFLFRTAGAFLPPGSVSMRSLAMAVYFFGVQRVLVMGHTSCRMASFDASAFIDAFRKRGVTREAFGTDDLRAWAGAIPDPQRGVLTTVANLRAAAFLPGDLEISGAVLDDNSGELEVVVRPGASEPARAAPAAAPSAAPLDPLVVAVRHMAEVLRARSGWRDELRALRTEIDRQHNPEIQLALIETFTKKVSADSREVREAIEQLKQEAGSESARKPQDLVHLLLRLAEGS